MLGGPKNPHLAHFVPIFSYYGAPSDPEEERIVDGKVMSYRDFPPGNTKTKEQKEFALMMITKKGVGKKVTAGSFQDVRRSGIIAMKLQKNDELLSVLPVEKTDSVILASKNGQAIRFKESDIRPMGRGAGGVRAMKLKGNDEIIGADKVEKDKQGELTFFTMSANGLGKKTRIKEYKIQKRGGSGIKTAKINAKTGSLVVGRVIAPRALPEDGEVELVAMSKQGQVIRVTAGEVPTSGRGTQGVRVMKLRPGDSLASVEVL